MMRRFSYSLEVILQLFSIFTNPALLRSQISDDLLELIQINIYKLFMYLKKITGRIYFNKYSKTLKSYDCSDNKFY